MIQKSKGNYQNSKNMSQKIKTTEKNTQNTKEIKNKENITNKDVNFEDFNLPYANYLCLSIGILLRWLTALHSYSGQSNPPMYGDFEAQRHWMEITLNLPIKQWYFNNTNNNLLYWGLDYPPITAYHSLINGYIAKIFLPDSVKLFTSRGYESYEHKYFMRLTVIIADILIYIPAVLYFLFLNKNIKPKFKLIFLIYPGIILIDHGHFQYNCVSLGLFIWSVIFVIKNKPIYASIIFCITLNYKQMELYHALPFFFYYLSLILKKYNFKLLFKLSITVLITFLIIYLPFLNIIQIKQIIHRIFPIYRGVFEDKVANLWCTLNVFYKFKLHYTNEHMALLCLCTTLITIIPSCVYILFKPSHKTFLLSLINISLAFFLFSFHVHEKSILLVAIPVLLYLPTSPFVCIWFLHISTFSMVDLFIKDNLVLPSLVLMYLFYLVTYSTTHNQSKYIKYAFNISLLGCVILINLILFVNPPKRYVHLFNLFIASYSFVHFFLFFIYFHLKLFQIDFSNILFSCKSKRKLS